MFGFAKKIGMTRIFKDGKHVAVTVLQVPNQTVIQTKTLQKDGYSSIQVGAYPKRKPSKAAIGHTSKHSGKEIGFIYIAEFKDALINNDTKEFTVNDIKQDDVFNITGLTIGRGFTGPIKRYGFAGMPATHGHQYERSVGSIGARWPQRTLPGTRMAGQHGNQNRTLRNVEVIAVDNDKKLIFVKGSLPGANSSVLKISKINI